MIELQHGNQLVLIATLVSIHILTGFLRDNYVDNLGCRLVEICILVSISSGIYPAIIPQPCAC
ncbi:hypothetical protein BGW80DRAFT_1348059 [Lactifluus volemus]|nr:hypothetical protein BGW80DRAFT_1348059 [Lactifluus volemus]